MKNEISQNRLEEQKEEFGFVREDVYGGISGGELTEYVGAFGVFACRIGERIYSCEA